jgi:hypothetical protein
VKLSEIGVTFTIGLCWQVLHFLLYAGILRHRPLFQTERGIFFYHFFSVLLMSMIVVTIGLGFRNEVMFAAALGQIAMHGVYSVSFLELWSLSQGSYSLSIMGGTGEEVSYAKLVDAFSMVGNQKKEGRVVGLTSFRLVCLDGKQWRLTSAGRLLANILAGILWLANIRERG